MPHRGVHSQGEGLPPERSQLIDPYKTHLETPQDEYNLIKVNELIHQVRETVSPDYEWPTYTSTHHLYWPHDHYVHPKDPAYRGQEKGDKPLSHEFVNLAPNKALLPRQFENWLHRITEPPVMPEPEVMQYRIEAWDVASSLFERMRLAVSFEKMRRRKLLMDANPELENEFSYLRNIDIEVIEESMTEHFDEVYRKLERNKKIPEQHRYFDADEPEQVPLAELGKLAVPQKVILVREASLAA